MDKTFLDIRNIIVIFIVFFIGAFLILSGRSFFSIVSYQISDVYHYFVFEIDRPINLALINPNNLSSWDLYKSENRKTILQTYLNPLNLNEDFLIPVTSTTTTKYNPLEFVNSIFSEIIQPVNTLVTSSTTKPKNISSSTTKPLITTTTLKTTATTVPASQITSSWKALIAKYPDRNFVFIPQFGVQAPLLMPASKDLNLIYKDLRTGVVLFPGTSNPGSGYSVILGHSSAYPWDPGDYRSVFSLLSELNYGDPFFVYYNKHIYAFKVVAKKIFVPLKKDDGITTVQALPPRDKPTVILQSCWPVGVSAKRMAVQGELISED
jgi:LPXTG-site transpeptidase (sortase) family protein